MNRLFSFFVFMAVFAIAFYGGSLYTHDPAEAQLLVDEFMKDLEGIDGVGIFIHNTTLALVMFIPGFGTVFGIVSGASTGYMLSAIMTISPEIPISPLELLFLTPFGLLEITAYSLAGSRSFLLIYKIIKKVSIRPDGRIVAIEVGVTASLLLVGGLIEYYMIEMAQEVGVF